MAFATAEDLATHLQRDLSAAETATATQALDIATSIIQSYTGQTLSVVSNDSVILRPIRRRITQLPQIPVTSIDSITEDGTLLAAPTYLGDLTTGFLYRVDASWGEQVTVVYDHGYTTIPADIRGVTLELAAAPFAGRGEIASEALGLYQVTYKTIEQAFSPLHRVVLEKYRPPLVA